MGLQSGGKGYGRGQVGNRLRKRQTVTDPPSSSLEVTVWPFLDSPMLGSSDLGLWEFRLASCPWELLLPRTGGREYGDSENWNSS